MFKKFCIYSLVPAHYNPSPTFYWPLRNNSQIYAQTNMKPSYCAKFVKPPVKRFRLKRQLQECTTVLFQRQKAKNNHKNVRKIRYWKLIFLICSYSTWVRKARKIRWHVSTWSRNLADSNCFTQKEKIFLVTRPPTCWKFDFWFWFLRKDKKEITVNL